MSNLAKTILTMHNLCSAFRGAVMRFHFWLGYLVAASISHSTPVFGQPVSLWTHNGSIMGLVADGQSRAFHYEQPRSGMQDEGVTTGTVLFDGARAGNTYSGIAYVFSRRCGQTPYSVSGTISSDERLITLYGQAPNRFNANCQPVGYRQDVLEFHFVRSLIAAVPETPVDQESVRQRELEQRQDAERQARERDRMALEERLAQEQRLRQLRDRQELEIRVQQERAALARQEREKEEIRLTELRAYSNQREACRQYMVSACNAALASFHATEQDRKDLFAWHATAVQFSADFSACQAGSISACHAALLSPVGSDDQRKLIDGWRLAASPPSPDRMLDKISTIATAVATTLRGMLDAFYGLPISMQVVGGSIAVLCALSAALLWSRLATRKAASKEHPQVAADNSDLDPIIHL